MAALRVSTVLTFLLTEQLLLAYVLLPELRNRFWTLVVYLLIIATTCMATSTIGLMCSALARRTATAMVMTYLTLLALFVFPMGVQSYLQTIASVTEEQLAALTVTSPFSAALSVPMHTTRSEAWINQPLAVADPVLVPIAPEFPDAGLGDLSLSFIRRSDLPSSGWPTWRFAGGGGVPAGSVRVIRVTLVDLGASRSLLNVPFSRYHILSGPRTRASVMGSEWIVPSLRWPRTHTFKANWASMRTLPALLSALKSATSKTSGVSDPA